MHSTVAAQYTQLCWATVIILRKSKVGESFYPCIANIRLLLKSEPATSLTHLKEQVPLWKEGGIIGTSWLLGTLKPEVRCFTPPCSAPICKNAICP